MRSLPYVGICFLLGEVVSLIAIQSGLVIVGPCTSDLGALCLIGVLVGFSVGTLSLQFAGARFMLQRITDRRTEDRSLKLSQR